MDRGQDGPGHQPRGRLALYSLVAGTPVWNNSSGPVNTCHLLHWKRSLACHLWYLTHPLASVADALHHFDKAWVGDNPHACTASSPSGRGRPTWRETTR